MTADDRTALTHLSRLGINPVVAQRLLGWAEAQGMSLRELVRYILSDYAPSDE